MNIFNGIRVVEVASWLFVPAAGAILADWGADVIKVEIPGSPDPQRSLVIGGMSVGDNAFTALMHQANRGKRSIGLDCTTPEGMKVLRALVANADVFLTNLLPGSRGRLGVDVDDIRKMNPNIVYARGSGYGPQGDDAGAPGYDGTAYYARGGVADSLTPVGATEPIPLNPAMGDLPGATALSGAIAAALFHRERTGVATVVDVSLLNVAVWGASPGIIASAHRGGVPLTKSLRSDNPNPATLAYRTRDGRFIKLSLFQSDRFFDTLCILLDVPELVADPRFADAKIRMENRQACTAALDQAFAAFTLDEVRERLEGLGGPWSVVQTVDEVGRDRQVLANGYLTHVDDGDGPIPVAASPWQFDEERHTLNAAPKPFADTNEILAEIGMDITEIEYVKTEGGVA